MPLRSITPSVWRFTTDDGEPLAVISRSHTRQHAPYGVQWREEPASVEFPDLQSARRYCESRLEQELRPPAQPVSLATPAHVHAFYYSRWCRLAELRNQLSAFGPAHVSGLSLAERRRLVAYATFYTRRTLAGLAAPTGGTQ